MEATERFDVFLSHAHVDATIVENIGVWLEDEAQLKVWLDRWIIVPGDHWQQRMAKGLEHAQTCAVCIGSQTPQGWFREEIERALNRQTQDTTFRVIPVILPGGDRSLVDGFLALRTWVDFGARVDDGFARHQLVSGIRGIPPGRYSPGPTDGGSTPPALRKILLQISELRKDQLIDDDIAVEYQRRVLDKIVEPGGTGSA